MKIIKKSHFRWMATRRYFVFVAIRCWELMYIFRNAPMYVGFLDLGCIIHCLICSFLASTPFSGLLVLINAKKKWDWNSSCVVTVAKSTLEFYLKLIILLKVWKLSEGKLSFVFWTFHENLSNATVPIELSVSTFNLFYYD